MHFDSTPSFPMPAGSAGMQTTFYGVPVGTVVPFMGKVQGEEGKEFYTPVEQLGWMVCDGRELKAEDYPELYMALGNLYGGEAGRTFNIPDLRGQFLRGVGSGGPNTPTPGSEENRQKPTSSDSYSGVGSFQKDALLEHCHQYPSLKGAAPSDAGTDGAIPPATEAYTSTSLFDAQHQSLGKKESTNETRPTNIAVYFIIKFTYQIQLYTE